MPEKEYFFANSQIKLVSENVEADIQEARNRGYGIPIDPDLSVAKTLVAHGLDVYPSEIPDASKFISARMKRSDDKFPGFNYGTFISLQNNTVAFAKLRYGPKNTEKAWIQEKIVDIRVGGLAREAEVLRALQETGYEIPRLVSYFPATPEDAEPDEADTLETLVIEACSPEEGSTLPPEKWNTDLAHQAASKVRTFTTAASEITLFADEERQIPIENLIHRAQLNSGDEYELTLADALGRYEHLNTPIIVHGDAWPNNIIVKYDGTDLMFIDWELAGPGYIGQDAGRTLWGLTLDIDWDFVEPNDTSRAFIDEWCRNDDDKNALNSGLYMNL